mgnify:FL=1
MGRIGKALKRIEDPDLLKGKGRFVADLNFPNQVYMRVLRSPIAFGKINNIDIDHAKSLEGVLEIWTGKDLEDIPPISFRFLNSS